MVIFFFICFLPFLFYWIVQTEDVRFFHKQNKQYDGALTTAVQDAAVSLKLNAEPEREFSYLSKKFSNINKEASYDSFMKSLSNNFGIIDSNKTHALQYYVPIFGVIEYEGYSSNRFELVGESVLRVWQPAIPYTHVDASGNIIRFTLDDYVYVYDRVTDPLQPAWLEGPRNVVAKESLVQLLHNEEEFERVRRSTIVHLIEESIDAEINYHNQVMSTMGMTYKFAVPLIPDETWDNTIDDVGIVAFIQGYPIHRLDRVYNQYAFAGSRLIKKEVIYATVDNGRKIFWEESCNYNYPKTEVYNSKAEAAKNGYTEKSCLNN